MFFNSLDYLFFLPIVITGYFLFPRKWRPLLLLSASYYFYACWKMEYLLLIIASTVTDYWVALRMEQLDTRRQRYPYLVISILINLGILFSFKYFNFFNESLRAVFNTFNIFYEAPFFDVLLPVGISFYTFQTLSYTIEIYRGNHPAERNLLYFALYVSYFPQLVAGPIERAHRLIPQLRQAHDFDTQRIISGLQLILWGFFKKVVIADRLAVVVGNVYTQPELHPGLPMILATYFGAFQIYCDFSGYTDIARGSAQMMGINLVENFRRPFFAKSTAELWNRWHISLASWFRDYLYIPLTAKKHDRWRRYLSRLLIFFLIGLWHGADWTFVIWGSLQGVILVSGSLTRPLREIFWYNLHRFAGSSMNRPKLEYGIMYSGWLASFQKLWRVLLTFHLFFFSGIFFLAPTMDNALSVYRHMFDWSSGFAGIFQLGLNPFELALGITSICLLLIVDLAERKGSLVQRLESMPLALRWATLYCILFWTLTAGYYNQTAFVYFQF